MCLSTFKLLVCMFDLQLVDFEARMVFYSFLGLRVFWSFVEYGYFSNLRIKIYFSVLK